jgi:lysophospholipase L1-like esterase
MTRKRLGRVLLVLGSTLLSLLLAEGVYRVASADRDDAGQADDAWRARISRMNHTIYERSEDARLVYEPRPSSRVEMEYGPAGFNAAGMRDDREQPRESSAPRIALVGDSVAWGEHLPLESSLARRLEAETGQTVLSFGVSGYDTEQEALWYERAVRPFHARTVVVVYCLNDVLIMSGPYNAWGAPADARRKDAQDAWLERAAPLRAETLDAVAEREGRDAWWKSFARLRALLRGATYERSARYTDELLLAYADAPRVAKMRASLRRLGAAIRADGASAQLVISPVLRTWDTYHWDAIHALVGRAAREAGFVVHDPLPEWRDTQRAEDLRLDSLHFGERGTRVLARYVAARLGPAGAPAR